MVLRSGAAIGNTNLGASNDARELEGWLKAGMGDDKTDIVVIADFYDRAAIYTRDRDIDQLTPSRYPGEDSIIAVGSVPGRVPGRSPFLGFRLIPRLFFSANSPPPHSAPNAATSPFYVNPFVIAPNAYPGPPGIIGPNATQHVPQTLGTYGYKGGGDYFFYNFAGCDAGNSSGGSPKLLWLFYARYLRQILNRICRL